LFYGTILAMHVGANTLADLPNALFPAGESARGALAGKVGQMAGTKQQLKASEPGKKTIRKRKYQTQQHNKAVHKKDALQSQRAAIASPEELAVILSRRVLAGDCGGVNTLVKVGDRIKSTKPAVKKRRGLSWVQRLALSPPWQGDPVQGSPPKEEPPTKPE
jgi:hypothetical protein